MNPGAFWAAPVSVQVHVLAALTAAVLGIVQFAGRKGTLPHRTIGWVWAVAMAVTALSSVAMVGSCAVKGFSVIHLLTAFTLFTLPVAVWHGRRGRVAEHRRDMISLYVGAMVIAGAFTLMPGRLMHDIVVGTDMSRTSCAVTAA
jgi:uncharacterized membrane protein